MYDQCASLKVVAGGPQQVREQDYIVVVFILHQDESSTAKHTYVYQQLDSTGLCVYPSSLMRRTHVNVRFCVQSRY